MPETIPTSPIQYQTQAYSEQEILDNLHPFVREWFLSRFSSFTPPQRHSIRNIQRGINSLISSPTGSGKTLSAFLAVLNELVARADTGTLDDSVQCIYLSPLKALANDITKNLVEPLREIGEIARRNGRALDIRIGTRTGDTPQKERARMLRRAPHILITTPESFAIMLTSSRFSQMVACARFVIIDEIHALAEGKRGVHLALSLERLARKAAFTRIGLSATVAPLEEVAAFLVGYEDPANGIARQCMIIDVTRMEDEELRYSKRLDLKVLSPVDDLIGASHHRMQDAMYGMIHAMIQEHRATLIFTNTRAGTERVVHQLRDRYPASYATIMDADMEQEKLADAEGPRHERLAEEAGIADASAEEIASPREARESPAETVPSPSPPSAQPSTVPEPASAKGFIGAHHGSLAKKHRLRIEDMLKAGELKAVVCSTSLELGIDIGYIDLVILLGSPKSVARALQRIGRSGHKLHEEAKGRIVVLDRDDLVECSVLLKAALGKRIDRISLPRNCLDVLAQQLYGMAIEESMSIEDAWETVRRAAPYRTLSRKDFDATLRYLAGEYGLEESRIYAKLWIDREQGTFGKKGKLARLIYMTNVGTIPDETAIRVKVGDATIGTITEDFAERLKPGDVFVLGGEPYEFRFSRGMTAQVKTSSGRLPTVPSWVSEMLPLSYDLALEIQLLRKYVTQLLDQGKREDEIAQWLRGYLPVDERAALAIARYFDEQHRYSLVPHANRMVIEHFKDANKRYVFFHSLYGRRVNDVLARALAYVNGRITGRDVEVGITDNGFYLKSTQPIQALRALRLLKKSEVLKRRFRHCAARALMILRTYKGETKSVGKQQVSSQIIISAVRRVDPDFPILKEARREILEDLMDVAHAREVVRMLASGQVRVDERSPDLPSPFAFAMAMHSYTDLLKMEDRVEFVRRLHELVVKEIGGEVAKKAELMRAPEVTYERLWEAQDAQRRLKEEDFEAYLLMQLDDAGRKSKLGADQLAHLRRLVRGERDGYPERFKEWLHAFLYGTVPRHWSDDLVKSLREREKRI